MSAKAKVLAFIGIFVFCVLSAAAHAQNSPVGQWNLRVSGIVKGDVYLTFTAGGTITGYIGLGRNLKAKVPDTIETVTFGTFNLTGEWNFNEKGRVVGYFAGIVEDLEFNVNSFTAKVQGGKMTMNAQSNDGPLTFKGELAVTLTDITGEWNIKVREREKGEKQEEVFTEVLDLTPSGFINVYDALGVGANYTVCGFLI